MALQWEDIDFDERTITFPMPTIKSSREKVIPFHSIRTTERYMHVDDAMERRAVEKLSFKTADVVPIDSAKEKAR